MYEALFSCQAFVFSVISTNLLKFEQTIDPSLIYNTHERIPRKPDNMAPTLRSSTRRSSTRRSAQAPVKAVIDGDVDAYSTTTTATEVESVR